MELKKCYVCSVEKPKADFYAQPSSSDGLAGLCKECHRKRMKDRRDRLANDFDWMIAERKRCRIKQRNYRAEGKYEYGKEYFSAVKRSWEKRNKHKRAACQKVNNAVRDGRIARKPCEVCGEKSSEAHHDDYSKPLEVIWLCDRHHKERHVKIREQQLRERLAK